MSTIRIPAVLRGLTGGKAELELTAPTVRAAIAELERRHPGVAAKLLDGDRVRPFIRIFVGSEDIGALNGLDTPLAARDEVAIVPAIAGGRGTAPARGVADA